MPMQPCDKCLENRWSFRRVDGWVFATCEYCGAEISWQYVPDKHRKSFAARARYLNQREARARGEVTCRKCGTPCERKTHDGPRPGKTTWYAWWFRCPRCHWLMMPQEAVRTTDNPHPPLDTASTVEAFRPDPNFTDNGVPPWE